MTNRLLILLISTSFGLLQGCKKSNHVTAEGGQLNQSRPEPNAKGNSVSGDSIIIGIVASESGALRPWGSDTITGAQMAVNEWNASGGIQGKEIKLIVGDSASKPEVGKSAAEMLISQGAVGLLGEVSSGITAQIATTAFAHGVPLIDIGGTRDDLTNIGSNIFRVCYTDQLQGAVMAEFAFSELHLKSVAMMTDRSQPYSVSLSDSFRKTFQALGGKIVDEQFYESGQTQFGSQLTNLKNSNPESIFLSGYFTEVGSIARQAQQIGLNAIKLGGDGWDSSELLNNGGSAIQGGYYTTHYNISEKRKDLQTFLNKWKTSTGQLPGTTMGALAYDAANLMLKAASKLKKIDSKFLSEAISNTENFSGVTGAISLKGRKGNPLKRLLVVKLTETGQKYEKAYEYSDIQHLVNQNK